MPSSTLKIEEELNKKIEYLSQVFLGEVDPEFKQTKKGKFEKVYFPYDGSIVGEYQIASSDQIEIALQKVSEGFNTISNLSALSRSKILSRTSEIILNRAEELANLICLEVGKPIKQARLEVRRTVELFQLAAEEALRINGEIIPLVRQDSNAKRLATYTYEPLGPILAITPFNFPLSTVSHKIAPAIAAGNSILLKPSPAAPLIAYNLLQILLEAGLPEEAICLLNCTNQQTEKLAQDYRIKLINFTGSSSIGWHLRSIAHPGSKTILELGGNAPVIIHKDADLEKAIPACLRGAFGFSGQTCISTQRIYLHERILPDFIEQFKEATQSLIIGNPAQEETDLGPLINKAASQRIHLWVEEAVSEGAKLLTGGKILENNCYAPTILRDVKAKMSIVCSEAFGPVVSLIGYNSIDDAIEQANDTLYGLSSAIFTQDLDLAFSASRKLKTGTVLVNDASAFRADEMPIGSQNQSGLGIEGPRFAIREMSNAKLTCLNLS